MAKRTTGRPATGRKPAYQLFARIKPELGEALRTYADSQEPLAKMSAHLEVAIKEYLVKRGAWPPPSQD